MPINLIGQEPFAGYRNGLPITGTKVERNLLGETEWNNRDSSSYLYDGQQRLLKKEDYYFNDTIWKAHSRTLFEYESVGQGYIQTNQWWYADKFMENKYKIEQEFNEQNQLVNFLTAEWISEEWATPHRVNYQYDEWGNVLNRSTFESDNGEWRLEWEEIFEFDSLGNQLLAISREYNSIGFIIFERGDKLESDTINGLPTVNHFRLDDGDWIWQKREISYFNNNQVLDSTIIHWHFGDTIKTILEYNTSNQLIQKTSFKVENNGLQPTFLYNYEYDENGYLILEDPKRWSNEADDYIEYEAGQREWSYADDGTLIKTVSYSAWAIEYGPGVAHNRNIIYYSNPLIVSNIEILENTSLQIFPNPTTQFLTIKLGENLSYPLDIRLINLQGQVLIQQKIEHNLSTLNVQALPSGPYFVQIRDKGEQLSSSKIMKQ